ncbi:MAG: hypothetical protein ACTS6P_00450 [Candidatus Hodgkinia cicadicola]
MFLRSLVKSQRLEHIHNVNDKSYRSVVWKIVMQNTSAGTKDDKLTC